MAGPREAGPRMAGLRGEYYEGPNFERRVFSRIDPQIDFNWNGRSPAPGVPREYFSVRWTGRLYAPVSGTYRFSATVDDGVRLWIGGKKVIDEWRKQDDTRFVGTITLTAGQTYDLRIDYYNDWRGSAISVYWELPPDSDRTGPGRERPGVATPGLSWPGRNVIPANYLSNRPPAPKPADKPAPVPPRPKPPVVTARAPAPAPKPKPVVRPPVPTPPVAKRAAEPPKPGPEDSLRVGDTVVLRSVWFAQSSYELRPESVAELNELVALLQRRPALRLDIGGHTDNVGDPRLNQLLSEHRATVVANYLIRQGVAQARLQARGYGGSQPLTDNRTDSARAQNRRVAFTIR